MVAASAVPDPLTVLALAATALPATGDDGSATDTARRLLAVAPSLLGGRRTGTIAERLAAAWIRRPSDELVTAIQAALVLLADHELATSTLAVRVACSVRAHPAAAIAAGLQVVRGPLHGGASRAAADLLADARRRGARDAVRSSLGGGRRLPGFGHTIYRAGDPRLPPLLHAVQAIPGGEQAWADVEAVLAEAGRTITRLPNVDLGLAALMHVGRLPHDAPIFAVARIAGWAAHYDEEAEERPVRFRGIARAR